MVREILKIYTDNGLADNPTFHDVELSEYTYTPSRMGMPTLTASLMWETCLDDEWTGREYVVLRGERFYIRHTPSSSKSNTDVRYKHDIDFHSEFDEILSNVYFEDYVPGSYSLTYGKPCSNSSVFTFYGTIKEFSDRLNCAFLKAGVGDSILKTKTNLTTLDTPKGDGFCSMIDPYGSYESDKTYDFSFENQFLWEAITQAYTTTEIPFERRGKRIVWGAVPKVLSQTFKYGHDNELLTISKNNANAKIVNRVTMLGSSENIPYYYPNETEYGSISFAFGVTNRHLNSNVLEIANSNQFFAKLESYQWATLGVYEDEGIDPSVYDIRLFCGFGDILDEYEKGTVLKHERERGVASYWHIRMDFNIQTKAVYVIETIDGTVWYSNTARPDSFANILQTGCQIESFIGTTEDSGQKVLTSQINQSGNGINLGTLEAGSYTLEVKLGISNNDPARSYGVTAFCVLNDVILTAPEIERKSGFYWQVGDKKYDGIGSLGVRINAPNIYEMVGESFQWRGTARMPFQERLVPPKYRNTEGAERFYNAYNKPYSDPYTLAHSDVYVDPDTGRSYEFPNPYIDGAPSEYIYENEDIKPTIEGVHNAKGNLMGEIAALDFDSDDNDLLKTDVDEESSNNALDYQHSYFYIKLNQFDGEYGFDLFKHAIQTDAMTLQMTSGKCNGCKFKIQAVEIQDDSGLTIWKNPVQVDEEGKIFKGNYTEKVSKTNFMESQQNTKTNSIWICVQKDAETFGVLMPNKEHEYYPSIGDTFNIINIELPHAYVLAAEKRLEKEGLRYMSDNNEEKFTFDINASRIFFAEHPEVLAQLDEYSKINIEYDERTYELYVSSLTITCKNNEALPDVKIDLSDTIAVGQSFQQRIEERAQSLIANASNLGGNLGGGGGLNFALADRRYLNKMMADRSPHKISTDSAFEVGKFVSGVSGGIFYVDPETGQTYIETDRLKVRMKAIFEELEIAHVTSVGGKQIITPGGSIDISYVEELEEGQGYRCYFKAAEDDKGAACRFVVGDQVQCQQFNIQAGLHENASNRYYWRLVTAVNNEECYVDLSKEDCDTGEAVDGSDETEPVALDENGENEFASDAPQIGDTICQLGNRTDPNRQSAIIFSTVDAFAPCITLYNGIDHYSLKDKEVVQYGVDKTKNPPEPFFHCYGSFFFGHRDKSSYLQFDAALGDMIYKGALMFDSNVIDEEGNPKLLKDYLNKYIKDNNESLKEDIEDFVQNVVGDDLKNLQDQIDGVIETWFFNGVPTLDNYPANQWKTEDERQNHAGDLYYDNTTGTAYRFSKGDNGIWYWNVITDDAITKALAAAQQAQDTADGKRRVFGVTPYPPYDEGDLWVNAIYPEGTEEGDKNNQYFNDLLRCITPQPTVAEGGRFNIAHWTKATKYTDDSSLNAFIQQFEEYKKDIAEQLDGKAETWYQPTDPSLKWSANEKKEHKGDLWYNTNDNTTWIWNGSSWDKMDVPESVFDAIDGKADIFISRPINGYKERDLWFLSKEDEKLGLVFADGQKWGEGTLLVAIRDMRAAFSEKDWEKKDKYTDDSYAHGFDYLKESLADALAQSSFFEGGLILTSHIMLGQKTGNSEWQCYSGISGLFYPERKGYGIAAWYGGDPIDGEEKGWATGTNERYAKTLFRMDGTGYLAGGNISWNADGSGQLAGGNIYWDRLGNLYLNSGLKIEGGDLGTSDTIESIVNTLNSITGRLVPMKQGTGGLVETTWREIGLGETLVAIRAKGIGFYADSFVSAKGVSSGGSGGSGGEGGSSTLAGLTDVSLGTLSAGQALVFNGSKWVNQTIQGGSGGAMNLSGLLDVRVNGVADGQMLIYRNGYWVNEGFDGNYVTLNTAQTITGVKTFNYGKLIVNSNGNEKYQKILVSYGNGYDNGHYFTFGFSPSNGNSGEIYYKYVGSASTSNAMNIGFYGKTVLKMTYGGDSTFSGSLTAQSFIKNGGTSSQFLKADGSVDKNTYLTSQELDYINVKDIRNTNPTPAQIAGQKITASFNNITTGQSGWHAIINVKGWSGSGYGAWQLASTGGNTSISNLFFRVGVDDSWGNWQTVLTSANYTSYVNPANFVTALGTSGNNLTWTKNGTVNNITVPFATTSTQTYRFVRVKTAQSSGGDVYCDANVDFTSLVGGMLYNYTDVSYWKNAPSGMSYGQILGLASNASVSLSAQLAWDVYHTATNSTRRLWWRAASSVGGWEGANWKQIAFTDSTVASATQLQNARTIWGQSFDGTANVDSTLHLKVTTAQSNCNQGIRLYGSAKDSTYSNICFGCDPSATSGTHPNQWYVGRNDNNNFAIDKGGFSGLNGIIITSGLNVGIGITAPSYKLHVSGEAFATHFNTSSTALVTNLNADLLDGIHESGFRRSTGIIYDDTLADMFRYGGYYVGSGDILTKNGSFLGFGVSNYYKLIRGDGATNNLFLKTYANGTWIGWREFAFTDSTVDKANQLATARTIWGQSFNGTGNVSGNMTGVGTITLANAAGIGTDVYGNFKFSPTSGAWNFYKSDGTVFLTLNASTGNLSIGVNSTTYKLHVVGDAYVNGAYRNMVNGSPAGGVGTVVHKVLAWPTNPYGLLTYISSSGTSYIQSQRETSTKETFPLNLNPYGGNVGIGITSNPSYKLHVAGVIYSTTGIFSDGYVSAKGVNTSSDARLKTNLKPLNLSLAQIANAPSVFFNWKATGINDFGSIAQYWQSLNPLFARSNPENALTIDYGKLALASVINVAKEVLDDKERIRKLELRVMELEQKLREA